MVKTVHIVRKWLEKKSNNFGTPYENVGEIEQEKDPQEQSGALKILSKLDTAEKPEQSNIQGVGINLVKTKSNG